jgi:2-polyprenyl-3-methyl-5-hydroxy-6-metoxy-1,4-benzoquinol methylase
MLESRSNQLEIIDLGPHAYTTEEYHDCLEKLDRIGRWLGGNKATLKVISKMRDAPNSILDVGCGGGLFTIRLAKCFPKAKVLGIDINPQAVKFAKSRSTFLKDIPPQLNFEIRDKKELDEPSKSFDVVTSTLVCHHIPDKDLIEFLTNACRIARKKVVLNDLHRHPLALYLFKLVSPVCFRNRLVLHDGPLSIRRGFKYHEWVDYLEQAGIKKSQYRIRWNWAFRWIVEIDCEESLHD